MATQTTAQPQDAEHSPPPGGPFSGYDDHHHPLSSYAALTAVFGTGFAASLAALHRSGRAIPETVSTRDVVLLGVATHKLSRLIAKDRVTQFLRAPFTRFQGDAGHGEVEEAARGTGERRAIGELLICPNCLGQWVVGALTVGMVGAPRTTRLVTSMYTALALSDVLQLGYVKAKESV